MTNLKKNILDTLILTPMNPILIQTIPIPNPVISKEKEMKSLPIPFPIPENHILQIMKLENQIPLTQPANTHASIHDVRYYDLPHRWFSRSRPTILIPKTLVNLSLRVAMMWKKVEKRRLELKLSVVMSRTIHLVKAKRTLKMMNDQTVDLLVNERTQLPMLRQNYYINFKIIINDDFVPLHVCKYSCYIYSQNLSLNY